jgi:hypothetical protein
MRLFVQKIVSFFMLGVIFTVSTGMGFIEHSCQFKDEKAIVFSKKQSCCAKKVTSQAASSGTTVKKSACCEDKNIYVHVDLAGYSQKIQKFISNVFIAITHKVFIWTQAIWFSKEEACQYTNCSPPQTGRDTLTKKSTLQI